MRKHLSTIVLLFILLIGLSLLLYPTVSDYWNSFHQTKAITTYAESVAALDNASYDAIWDAARQYNRNLLNRIEVMTPVLDEDLKADLMRTIDYGMRDTTNGRLIDGKGTQVLQEGDPFRSQEQLHNAYAKEVMTPAVSTEDTPQETS